MKAIVGEADDETITCAKRHGFRAGDVVEFIGLSGGAGLTGRAIRASGKPTRYFVIATGLTDRVFSVSETLGGSAVNFTTDITAGYVRRAVRVPGDA